MHAVNTDLRMIEYPSFSINYLVQVIGVELVGSSALIIHRHTHLLELLHNKLDALIHRYAMSEQSVYRLGKWIVLVIANTIGFEAAGNFLLFIKDTRWYTGRRRSCRDIFHHHRIRADFRAVAYGDRAEYLGSRPHHHAVAQGGVPFAVPP